MTPTDAARALVTARERYSPKADPASIEIPVSTPEAIRAQKINRLRKLFPEMKPCGLCGQKAEIAGTWVIPAEIKHKTIKRAYMHRGEMVPAVREPVIVSEEKTYGICTTCLPGLTFAQERDYPIALLVAGLALGETPTVALAVVAAGNRNLAFAPLSNLPDSFDQPLVTGLTPWMATHEPDESAQPAWAHVNVTEIKAATKRVLSYGKGRRPYPVQGEGCYICGVRTLEPKADFKNGRIPTSWHQIGAPNGVAFVCGDDFSEGCAPLVAAFGIKGGRDAALQDYIGIADAMWSDLGLPRRLPVSETPFGSIDPATVDALRAELAARQEAEKLPTLAVVR